MSDELLPFRDAADGHEYIRMESYKELRQENDVLKTRAEELQKLIAEWQRKNERMEADNERLREALKFASDHIQHEHRFDKPCVTCAINKALEGK